LLQERRAVEDGVDEEKGLKSAVPNPLGRKKTGTLLHESGRYEKKGGEFGLGWARIPNAIGRGVALSLSPGEKKEITTMRFWESSSGALRKKRKHGSESPRTGRVPSPEKKVDPGHRRLRRKKYASAPLWGGRSTHARAGGKEIGHADRSTGIRGCKKILSG